MRNPTFALAATVLALSSCLPNLVVGQAKNDTSASTSASATSAGKDQATAGAATTAATIGQDTPSTLNCTTYTNANAANATCNDDSSRVCSGKCTGAVSIDKCSLKPEVGPFSEEACTISYGKSSATMYICINEKGSFTCTGTSKGSATCSGCASKGDKASSSGSGGTSSTSTGTGSTNGTSTGAGGNGTSTDKPNAGSRLDMAGPFIATTGLLAGLLAL